MLYCPYRIQMLNTMAKSLSGGNNVETQQELEGEMFFNGIVQTRQEALSEATSVRQFEFLQWQEH